MQDTFDLDAFESNDAARFALHNEHGHCYCATCEAYRLSIDQSVIEAL